MTKLAAGLQSQRTARSDLIRPPEARDLLILHSLRHLQLPSGDHFGDHRGLNRPRADRIDPYTARRVFERGASCEADHAVLGCVIGSTAGKSDEAPKRGAVDDGAATLPAHPA